jgi:hypothetical protein
LPERLSHGILTLMIGDALHEFRTRLRSAEVDAGIANLRVVHPGIVARLRRMAKPLSPRKRVARIMAASAVAIWFGYLGLFLQYAGTRPRSPQPKTGRIYSINNHGTIAWLNQSENLRLWLTSGSAVAIFITAMALDRWPSKSP